jgi:sortase A
VPEDTQQLPDDTEQLPDDTQQLPDNTEEDPSNAEQLPESDEKIPENTEQLPEYTEIREMARIKVDGYDCIGILSIPALNLKLPVLTDWSYTKLKKAPCHYYGSYYEKDFVIAAHNYKAHFRRLSELQPGDIVLFTDVNGEEYFYEVILLETLPKDATKEMITSGFDLSLYTCTPGRASRVTARCNAISKK